jgi:hypothetical protein
VSPRAGPTAVEMALPAIKPKTPTRPTNVLERSTFSHHGARGSVVVKALCYKPEDRGFDTR